MTPELQSYIDQCRQQGASDEEIRAALLASGWKEEQFSEAFTASVAPAVPVAAVMPPSAEPALPARKGKSRVGVTIAAVVGAAILLGGATVALGEFGYVPAASQVYRKTNLPLVWSGTNGNTAVSLGRALIASLDSSNIKLTLDTDVIVTQLSEDLPAQMGVESLRPKQADGTAFASVSSESPEPTRIKGTVTASFHEEKGVKLGLALDLAAGGLDDLIGAWLKPSPTLTLDGIFPAAGTTVFARTNALPIPRQSDAGRWWAWDLPEDASLKEAREEARKQLAGDREELETMATIVNALSEDKGIVRRNGQPMAWYQTLLSQERLIAVSQDPALPQDVREELADIAQTWQGQTLMDWYMDARKPVLREVAVNGAVTSEYATVTTAMTLKLEYGEAADFAVPGKDAAWTSFEDYMSALQEAYPDVADTGIFTREALDWYMQPTVAPEDATDGEELVWMEE